MDDLLYWVFIIIMVIAFFTKIVPTVFLLGGGSYALLVTFFREFLTGGIKNTFRKIIQEPYPNLVLVAVGFIALIYFIFWGYVAYAMVYFVFDNLR